MTPMNLQRSTKLTIFGSMVGVFLLLIWAALWVPHPTWKLGLAVGAIFVGLNVGFVLLLDLKARGYRLSPRGQRRVRWILACSRLCWWGVHVLWLGIALLFWVTGDRPTAILWIKLFIPLALIMGVLFTLLRHPVVTYWGEAQ